jgi:hypothetical protein
MQNQMGFGHNLDHLQSYRFPPLANKFKGYERSGFADNGLQKTSAEPFSTCY